MWCSCTAPLFKFVFMNCNHNSWVTVFSNLPSSCSHAAHPPVVAWFSMFADCSHLLFQTLDSDSHPIHDLSQAAFHSIRTAGSNSDDWWGPTLLWAGLSPCGQLNRDLQDCFLLRDCTFAGQSFDGLALVICGLYRLLFQWLATSHVGQMHVYYHGTHVHWPNIGHVGHVGYWFVLLDLHTKGPFKYLTVNNLMVNSSFWTDSIDQERVISLPCASK